MSLLHGSGEPAWGFFRGRKWHPHDLFSHRIRFSLIDITSARYDRVRVE